MNLLRKNIFSLLIFQGGNYIIPLMTLPYLTRVLDINGFGLYSTVFSLSQYFIIFIDYGFNLSATKSIAKAKDNTSINKIFWKVIHTKMVLFLVSGFVLTFLCFLNMFSFEVLILLIMFLGSVFTPLWFFQGIENLSSFTKVILLAKFLTLPLYFLLVHDSGDVWLAIGVMSSVNFLSAIFSLIIIKRNYPYIRYEHVSVSDIIYQLKKAAPIFWATLTISLYTSSTTLIMSSVSTIEQVSLFSAGDRIRGAILGVFLVLGNAIYPRVNKLFSQSEKEAFKLVRIVLSIQTVLCGFMLLFFLLFSGKLANVFYGESFSQVGSILIIFVPAYFFILQSTVLGNYILLPLGYNKAYAVLPTLCAIIHIPLCAALSHYFGAIGGAASITIVEAISFLFLVLYMYKKSLLKKCLVNSE